MEWAGAFGDLGTLIPFIVAYITILKLNPTSILLAFGLSLIFSGLYYKTPIPVQPMKAIGAAAIAKAGVSVGMVWGAGIATGLFWALMGITNVLGYLGKLAKKPVATGIILGVGLSFVREAFKLMTVSPMLALAGLLITFLLLKFKKVPAIFLLLCLGIGYAFVTKPGLFNQLGGLKIGWHIPIFSWGKVKAGELVQGAFLLALPQIPLTFGNGILAITTENNALFPKRPVSEKKIALTTGLMNIFSTALGGIPMCHGAGGMAGHVRFGAKTGGSLVILGAILTLLAVFFGSSVVLIFNILPKAVLGVILFFAGWELLQTYKKISWEAKEIITVIITALISVYNVGLGFLLGLGLYYILEAVIRKSQ